MNTQTVHETWRKLPLMSDEDLDEEIVEIEIEKSRRKALKLNPYINWHTNVSIH